MNKFREEYCRENGLMYIKPENTSMNDYVEFLENKLTEQLRLCGVGSMLKVKKKRCYTTWKKHSGITTMHKQKYKDSNGKILKAKEVRKMYKDYMSL